MSALAANEVMLSLLFKHVTFWARGCCLNKVYPHPPEGQVEQEAAQSSAAEDTQARMFASWFKPSPQLVSSAWAAQWRGALPVR
jgi:hypothetical protein